MAKGWQQIIYRPILAEAFQGIGSLQVTKVDGLRVVQKSVVGIVSGRMTDRIQHRFHEFDSQSLLTAYMYPPLKEWVGANMARGPCACHVLTCVKAPSPCEESRTSNARSMGDPLSNICMAGM